MHVNYKLFKVKETFSTVSKTSCGAQSTRSLKHVSRQHLCIVLQGNQEKHVALEVLSDMNNLQFHGLGISHFSELCCWQQS
jgi:queuine/archaeosine tRNA-ribosyltransferase